MELYRTGRDTHQLPSLTLSAPTMVGVRPEPMPFVPPTHRRANANRPRYLVDYALSRRIHGLISPSSAMVARIDTPLPIWRVNPWTYSRRPTSSEHEARCRRVAKHKGCGMTLADGTSTLCAPRFCRALDAAPHPT